MEDLRDCHHIAYLVTAFRTEDQIIAVMPYSRHADFRVSVEGEENSWSSITDVLSPGVLPHHALDGSEVLLSMPLWCARRSSRQ